VTAAQESRLWEHRDPRPQLLRGIVCQQEVVTGRPGGGEFVNDCGGGVWANSTRSCPFAQNVHQKWWDPSVNPKGAAGGASELTIDVYSPVTNQTYTMTCWRDTLYAPGPFC